MKERISRGLFWIISVTLFVTFIYEWTQKVYEAALYLLTMGGISNPYILDKLSYKFEKKPFEYLNAIRMLFFLGAIYLAYIITVLIVLFIYNNKEIVDVNEAMSNFESTFKMVVYLLYFILLLLYRNADKYLKYSIFMLIYFTCTIMSYAPQSIIEQIIAVLNCFTNSNLSLKGYEILYNDILNPIKEAILTYIILDTVMGKGIKDKTDNLSDEEVGNNKNIKNDNVTKRAIQSKKQKKRVKYTPYNFDEKFEYKIYKKIGRKHKREFILRLIIKIIEIFIPKMKKDIRKAKRVKKEKKYSDYNTYAEWKIYFKKQFSTSAINNYNFQKYLNKKLRIYQRNLEISKSLAIPAYICEITLFVTIFLNESMFHEALILVLILLVGLSFVLLYGIHLISKNTKRINFIKDCMKIIK